MSSLYQSEYVGVDTFQFYHVFSFFLSVVVLQVVILLSHKLFRDI